jgi:hypothetical protein
VVAAVAAAAAIAAVVLPMLLLPFLLLLLCTPGFGICLRYLTKPGFVNSAA